MKKLILFVILAIIKTTSLFANVRGENLSEDELNKQLQAEALLRGEDTESMKVDTDKTSQKTSSSRDNNDKYEDVALYNLINRYNTENDKKIFQVVIKEKTTILADNVGEYTAKLQALDEKKKLEQQNKEKEAKETKTVYFSGYCFTNNAIEVENIQGYGVLDCTFEKNELNIDSSKMMAVFVPITSRSALIAKPIYLLDKTNKKTPIQSGVVLTLDRTSLNIANFVNDKKIKKLSGELLNSTGDIILNQSVAYLNQLEESKRKEEIITSSSISGTTQSKTTNTEAPDGTTYLIHSGIQFISGLFKLGGLVLSEDKYPYFKVYKDSGFYVDFIVEINGEKGIKTKENKELEKVDYKNNIYDETIKPISIGEDVAPQKLQLPSTPLGN